jgi:hypothetical protein
MSKADVAARIAAARAELEELEKAREARAAENREQRALEQAQLALSNAKAIARAEEELGEGKFATVTTTMGVVIVRRPHPMHFRRFQREALKNGELDPDKVEAFAKACVFHPAREEFAAMLDEIAGVAGRVANMATMLANGEQMEFAEKP